MTTSQPAPDAPRDQMKRAKEFFRKLGGAGPLAIVAATLPPLGGFVLLGSLKAVGPWLKDHGGAGVAVYIGGFIVLAGLALLPTYAQAILGGWAFGVALGFPAALAGFAGAALLGYAVARRAAGDKVMDLLREKPQWIGVRDALVGRGFWRTLGIVALLRLPPNSPFAVTNLVMASAKVPPAPYLLGTAIGMSPRTLAAVFVGSQAKSLFDAETKTPNWVIASGIVLTVVVLIVVGSIANRAIKRITAPGAAGAP